MRNCRIRFVAAVLFLLLNLSTTAAPRESVNINHATEQQLTQLKGIGIKKARRIIEYREKHGPFRDIYELVLIKGIGEKTVQKNIHWLRVDPVDTYGHNGIRLYRLKE